MKPELKNEAIAIVDKAIWIGITDPSKHQAIIDLASKSQNEFNMVKMMLTGARKALVSQFDTYARDGGLEGLKLTHTDYFKKLWRAKHDKEYSGKLHDAKVLTDSTAHQASALNLESKEKKENKSPMSERLKSFYEGSDETTDEDCISINEDMYDEGRKKREAAIKVAKAFGWDTNSYSDGWFDHLVNYSGSVTLKV